MTDRTKEQKTTNESSPQDVQGAENAHAQESRKRDGEDPNVTVTGRSAQAEPHSRLGEMRQVLARHKIMQGITPVKLREVLEDLGPTYIKLGQIMSLHSDILPKEYCDELMKLNSDVTPMPFSEVESVLREAYGGPWQDIFRWISQKPIGSASIAQVHRATLMDGSDVIIKVQRKGIYDVMSRDIALLHKAAGLIGPVANVTGITDIVDINMILDELWSTAQEEMDFLKEASNMEEFARYNKDVAYVSVPKLYREYSTSHVLVMEYIGGCPIDDVKTLKAKGYDLEEIGRKFANNYIKQVMDDGFFHADPHPGNVKVCGGKIVWIDMGMMGRLTERDRLIMAKGVRGIGLHDIAMVENAVLDLGTTRGVPDRGRLYKDLRDFIDNYGSQGMGEVDIADAMQSLMEIMKRNRIRMPHGMTMLARGLAHLEGVLYTISPSINMMTIASSRVKEEMVRNTDWKKEVRSWSWRFLRSAEKGVEIPSLLVDVLNNFQAGRSEVNLNLNSSDELSQVIFQAVRNLVIGMCVAALLISSSTICTTDMEPKILGIPALGVLGYVAALLIAMFFSLRHWHRKRKK